jgi:hypothetical protein
MAYIRRNWSSIRSYIIACLFDLRPWLVRAIGCGLIAACIVFGSIGGFTCAVKTFGVKKEMRK